MRKEIILMVMTLVVMNFTTSINADEQLEEIDNIPSLIENLKKQLRCDKIDIAPVDDDDIVFVDDNAEEGWYDETHVRTIQDGVDKAALLDMEIVFVYNGNYSGKIKIMIKKILFVLLYMGRLINRFRVWQLLFKLHWLHYPVHLTVGIIV